VGIIAKEKKYVVVIIIRLSVSTLVEIKIKKEGKAAR
jgi:hypothetical protein